MNVDKRMLQQYLVPVAVNLGLMNEAVAKGIAEYDRSTFVKLLEARIEHLRSESKAENAFFSFSPDYYSGGIEVVSSVLRNLDRILALNGREHQ